MQQFFLVPVRPKLTAKTWLYRGSIHRVTKKGGCPSARTRITRGAQIALDRHAEHWRVTATGIVRGIITDFLEGRTTKLKIVNYAELWGDPERYPHPETTK